MALVASVVRKVNAFDVLEDRRAVATLARLHTEADGQFWALLRHYLPMLPRVLIGRRLPWHRMERFYADKYIALEREQAAFCHLVARSIGARRIVELGTSFGVSTIWLAAAVRANGGGVVITTEVVREKALRAHRNIDDAGLGRFVEIRVGDARETLRDLAGPIDLLLIDGYPPAALDVLRIVAPHLRTGAVVLADNVGSFKADLAD